MKITHYLYNAFTIESQNKKLAIDPGGLFLYFLRLSTLIPKCEWPSITHIFLTHGDPDHYWHFDRVLKESGAEVVCNKTMVQERDGTSFMLGPRNKGIAFTLPVNSPHTLEVGETIEVNGVKISGIKTVHGQLLLKLGPFSTTVKPGPTERVGWGALGFLIELHGKTVLNLGDTLLQADDWKTLPSPDVLMIPIGGKVIHNTMNEEEALQAVEIIKPQLVIPCHYNCPAFFTKKYNPANESAFKKKVETLGARCEIMRKGDSLNI
ncbi:metal-dependent hydrolase [Aurantivibrio infirmus]